MHSLPVTNPPLVTLERSHDLSCIIDKPAKCMRLSEMLSQKSTILWPLECMVRDSDSKSACVQLQTPRVASNCKRACYDSAMWWPSQVGTVKSVRKIPFICQNLFATGEIVFLTRMIAECRSSLRFVIMHNYRKMTKIGQVVVVDRIWVTPKRRSYGSKRSHFP